jgi:uncharacterized membrane protein
MKVVLEYLSTLLHLLGMLLLVGGHLWFAFFSAFAERTRDREGEGFLARFLPVMANMFGSGVLLLFGSGLLKLLLWREPGLIFLPDPYGWILLSKLLLYMVIVMNGLWIERRYLPTILQQTASPPDRLPLGTVWENVKRRARLNFLLILVVLVLGETLRYAKL